MDLTAHSRRGFLGLTAAGMLSALSPRPAHALDVPTGPVILTITGRIAHPNAGGAAENCLSSMLSFSV